MCTVLQSTSRAWPCTPGMMDTVLNLGLNDEVVRCKLNPGY